tara:strand:+ start:1322 stop:2065 length:744 start_codon:yes stop_codon:yes gene_type:complete
MDTLLLFASSQKWIVRAFFTLLIVSIVYLSSVVIDHAVALSGQSIKTMNIRGGIFLMLFLITVIISSVFSRGHHYRSPAIALFIVFLMQTGVIFILTSVFKDSELAKIVIFPIVYAAGYFAYQWRDVITMYVCGIWKKGQDGGRANLALIHTMKPSITAPLIAKGLRGMAILYTLYSIVSICYVYYRKIDFMSKTSIKEAIELYHDLDFVAIGSYCMDVITLYFVVILIGGISRSIREDKARVMRFS